MRVTEDADQCQEPFFCHVMVDVSEISSYFKTLYLFLS